MQIREGLTSNNEGDCKRYHIIIFTILIAITIVIAGFSFHYMGVLNISNYPNISNYTNKTYLNIK